MHLQWCTPVIQQGERLSARRLEQLQPVGAFDPVRVGRAVKQGISRGSCRFTHERGDLHLLAKQLWLGKVAAGAVGVGKDLCFLLRLAWAIVLVGVLMNMDVMTKVTSALTILMLAIGRRHRIAKLQRQDQKQQDVQQSAHETSLKTISSEWLGGAVLLQQTALP
jgi:hypothetical protein